MGILLCAVRTEANGNGSGLSGAEEGTEYSAATQLQTTEVSYGQGSDKGQGCHSLFGISRSKPLGLGEE